MTPNMVRLDDCPPQPWKNGGGLTRALLTWAARQDSVPGQSVSAGSTAASDWDLRVSVADITRDGPFSEFPGIDRCFAVLQGAGVELQLSGQCHRLEPTSPPLAFRGEEPAPCRLLAGPTVDLNLMGRRSTGRIGMRRALAGEACSGGARWRGLFAVQAAWVDFGAGPCEIPAGTLCWLPAPGTAWTLLQGGQALWLTQERPE